MVEFDGNTLSRALVKVAEADMVQVTTDIVHAAAFVAARPSELGGFLSAGARVRAAIAQANLEHVQDLSRSLRGRIVVVDPIVSVED